jgi:hypothetical protein
MPIREAKDRNRLWPNSNLACLAQSQTCQKTNMPPQDSNNKVQFQVRIRLDSLPWAVVSMINTSNNTDMKTTTNQYKIQARCPTFLPGMQVDRTRNSDL